MDRIIRWCCRKKLGTFSKSVVQTKCYPSELSNSGTQGLGENADNIRVRNFATQLVDRAWWWVIVEQPKAHCITLV